MAKAPFACYRLGTKQPRSFEAFALGFATDFPSIGERRLAFFNLLSPSGKSFIRAFFMDEAWQGLKPDPLLSAICGPAKAVPLLQGESVHSLAEFFARCEVVTCQKTLEAWQGLKPDLLSSAICGAAKAVPLLQGESVHSLAEFFLQAVKS